MAKVQPADLLKTTQMVGFALDKRKTSVGTAKIQIAICERLVMPLVVDLELRRGLADLAKEEWPCRDDRKAAKAWLLKLIGAEPL